MNPNNDDNAKVNANCCYDDTNNSLYKYNDDCGNNNILSFYFWWKQVQVRVLDDDHNDVTIDHASTYNVMSDKGYCELLIIACPNIMMTVEIIVCCLSIFGGSKYKFESLMMVTMMLLLIIQVYIML